jgi:hypothetical protein
MFTAKIPAADAGEHEITASFYADNQIAVQKTERRDDQLLLRPSGSYRKDGLRRDDQSDRGQSLPRPGRSDLVGL